MKLLHRAHSVTLSGRMTKSVRLRVPATSANLGPGFDALGLALDLWNEVEFWAAAADALHTSGEGELEMRGQTTSLAHDAARRVWQALDLPLERPLKGAQMTMHNAIPFSRGLGSSSAAIVAGLVGANEWARREYQTALSDQKLLELAVELEGHGDNVAPALRGGFVIAATHENTFKNGVTALNPLVVRWPKFVVWIPNVELSTSRARGVLESQISRSDAIFNLARTALLVGALAAGDFEVLKEALRDRLHQDARAPLVPNFEAVARLAHEAGALGVTLSGAGPTILCWCADDDVAVRVANALATSDFASAGDARPLKVALRGAYLVE